VCSVNPPCAVVVFAGAVLSCPVLLGLLPPAVAPQEQQCCAAAAAANRASTTQKDNVSTELARVRWRERTCATTPLPRPHLPRESTPSTAATQPSMAGKANGTPAAASNQHSAGQDDSEDVREVSARAGIRCGAHCMLLELRSAFPCADPTPVAFFCRPCFAVQLTELCNRFLKVRQQYIRDACVHVLRGPERRIGGS